MFLEHPVPEGNEFVRWQSAIVHENMKDKKVTFVMPAGMGCNLGEGLHELFMNGRKILEISTVYGVTINWKSEIASGKFETTHVDHHNDIFGLFSVTVAPEVIEFGKGQVFEMKGKSSSSNNGWFAVCEKNNFMNLNVRELQSRGDIADKIARMEYPVDIDISREIIPNPGIGIMEFGDLCKNDAELTKHSKYGPDTAPDLAVGYYRWYWASIEPELGKYNWKIIDWALARAERRGQQLRLGIMPHGTDSVGIPPWYKGKLIEYNKASKAVVPDYNDVYFQEHTAELVKKFGERYDGHPGIYAIDIRTLGAWGEWGSGPESNKDLMDEAGIKWAIDIYFNAFSRTPLMASILCPAALSYAVSRGAGWFGDGWGNLHARGRGGYPRNIVAASVADAWKTSPVAFETYYDFHYWHKMKWDVDYILEEAVRWHASTINAKFLTIQEAIPEEWRCKVDRFRKRIGYRFELRQMYLPELVRHGQNCAIRQWWVNVGNAPVYHDCRVILRLRNGSATLFHETGTDLKGWLPGYDHWINSLILIPPEYRAGDYEVSVGIARPGSRIPEIIPANKNVSADKWLHAGVVRIAE
ncbi:MAG: DUF4832 domain-containing protein [Verrucomicrobiae bacterium]|nr:DUF4832 domain-containing protein [Verrucomicrobiae bacterium]